jgi:hypothetical protein
MQGGHSEGPGGVGRTCEWREEGVVELGSEWKGQTKHGEEGGRTPSCSAHKKGQHRSDISLSASVFSFIHILSFLSSFFLPRPVY